MIYYLQKLGDYQLFTSSAREELEQLKKWLSTLVCTMLLSTQAHAALPTDAPGGADKTALIYTGYAAFADGNHPRNWGPSDFQPYMTYMMKDPQTGQLRSVNTKMFDTFLFLSPWASSRTDGKGLFDISGMYKDHTQGNKAEWQSWLDLNFQSDVQLDALARAVRDYARPLTPGYKAKVIMMMPYPDTSVTNWEPGVSFQNYNNRLNAVKWFLNEFLAKYNSARTSFDGKPLADYLDLTGLYWMKENFSDNYATNLDNQLIPAVNQYINSLPPQNGKPLRSYVIPYMTAEAYSQRVHPWGFDHGWLQPSHYFNGGSPQGNYDVLGQADSWANKYGLGLELEVDWQAVNNDYYLRKFRDYLNFGSENGWMTAPIALYSDIDYFGTSTLDQFAGNTNNPNTNLRSTYDDLYLFLNDAYNPNKLTGTTPVSTKVKQRYHNTHPIQLQAGSNVTVRLTTTSGNADVYLLDENFSPVARSTRLGTYQDEISYQVPKSGTYYVRVFGNVSTGYSPYTASIEQGLSKSGVSPSTAVDMGIGQPVQKRSGALEDQFYKVSLSQGQTYTITAKPGSTVQDVDLYLYANPLNDEGSRASHKGPAAAEQIEYTPSASGDYYVMIRGGNMASDYNLQLQTGKQTAPEDGYEAKTAFTLNVDGKLANPILQSQNLWYKVPVEQGKTYTVLLQPQNGIDVDLDLFSSIDTSAGANGDLAKSDRGPGITDAVAYTASTTGFVYARVSGVSAGSFEINALPGMQLPAGYTADNPIALNGSHSYQVNQGDTVYYSLPVQSGKDYLVTMTPATASMNADLEMYDSSVTTPEHRVAYSREGSGTPDKVLVHADKDGQYILKVNGVNQTNYTLQSATPAATGSSPLEGKILTPGTTVQGTLGQGQTEYAKVWLNKGVRYRIEAAADKAGQDVDIDVFKSAAVGDRSLVGSSHGPAGYHDQLSFTPLETGYYFVRVKGYTGVEYSLNATKQ